MITQILPRTALTAFRLLKSLPSQTAHRFRHVSAPSQFSIHCTRKGISLTVSDDNLDRRVQLPLVEQPDAATVPAQTILEWYKQQQTDLQKIGDDLSQTMDGPTATDLQVRSCMCSCAIHTEHGKSPKESV